jgi:hypothetical protein
MTTQTAAPLYQGVWTPWGAVWCLACDGRHPQKAIDKLASGPRPEAETVCDKCGARVAVRCDVGHEHRLLRELRPALVSPLVRAVGMDQLGGMCSAAGVHFADGSHVWIKHDEDSEPEARVFVVSYYRDGDDEEGRPVVSPGKLGTTDDRCGRLNPEGVRAALAAILDTKAKGAVL